jgi:signal transduction histidine kinase
MGITRGFTIIIMMPVLDIETSQSLVSILAYSISSVFYWFIAGSIISNFSSKFRSDLKKLIQILADRRVEEGLDIKKLNERSKVLLARIARLQSDILDSLKREPTRENFTEHARNIDFLVREHIRPLSHSEWRDGELVTSKIGLLRSLKAVLKERKIPVLGIIVLILPYVFMTKINNFGIVTGIFIAFTWISILLTIRLVAFLVTQRVKGTSWFWNLFFLISAGASFIITTTFILLNVTGTDYELLEIIRLQTATALRFTIVSCVATFAITLIEDERAVLNLIANSFSAKDADELLETANHSQGKQEYAQYLHAEVQSHLLACKLLLLKSAESDFTLLSTEVTRQVIERFESIKEPYVRSHVRKTTDRVEEIALLWKGLCAIEHSIPPEFDDSAAPRDVISQLIEESVVNAIRHGEAKNIEINGRAHDGVYSVEIINDGTWQEGNPSTGLGTILFETFASDWSLNRNGDRTVMAFRIDSKVSA